MVTRCGSDRLKYVLTFTFYFLSDLQECHRKRTHIFHLLLGDLGHLKKSYKDLQQDASSLHQDNESKKTALEEAQAEIARLKSEIDLAQGKEASLKTALEESNKRHDDVLKAADTRVLQAESALGNLRDQTDLCLAQLKELNEDLDREFSDLSLQVFIAFLFSDQIPDSLVSCNSLCRISRALSCCC
jgi:septal ring factor EnvC (AmiA/AmiB activator)